MPVLLAPCDFSLRLYNRLYEVCGGEVLKRLFVCLFFTFLKTSTQCRKISLECVCEDCEILASNAKSIS